MNIFKMRPYNYMRITRQVTARLAACLCVPIFIAACDPGQPEPSSGFAASGYAAPLSQAEFNSLPPEEQYQVASKLYGTLFRGITVEEFFDMDAGVENLTPRSSTFINDTRSALQSHLTTEQHFVLDGEYESEGKLYGSGSYRLIPAHVDHGPFVSKNGALVLVIWDN